MRLLWTFLTLSCSLFMAASADLTEVAELLPACGLKCTVASIRESTCSMSNSTCICTNEDLAASITTCVSSACTVTEQLVTKNVSDTACGKPVRNQSGQIRGIAIGGCVFAFFFYLMRIASRLGSTGVKVGLDDYAITVATACLIVFSLIQTQISEHGLGKDIWTISPSDITYILKLYYINELLYLLIVACTKGSILFFYLRIFPEKQFRMIVYTVLGFCIAYWVAFEIVSIFQCYPIQAAWLHWDGSYAGACNNVNAQGWAAAIFNIILDAAILLLPLRQISNLALNWKKRLQLLLMFCVGGFVTVVSILRLDTLTQFANTANFTWLSCPFANWSTIEMDVGIICACMPAAQALLKRLFPTLFGGATRKTTGISNSTGRSGVNDQSSTQKSHDKRDFIQLKDKASVGDLRAQHGSSEA